MNPVKINRTFCGALACLVLLSACDVQPDPRPSSDNTDSVARAPDARGGSNGGQDRLIPRTAGLDRVGALVRDPVRDSIAGDPRMTAMIRRGFDIFRNTPTAAPALSGNALSCSSCHLNGGQKEGAWPLVGVATLFPHYRARNDRLISLEDRIADCFERSMNGKPPARGSEEMLALSSYLTWLSRGLPAGEEPAWRGVNALAAASLIPVDQLLPDSGRALYERNCVACHGADGQGVDLGVARPAPLWGPRSWNDGAGAARVYTLAGFIRHAMPLTAPGSLGDGDAQHLAAFINAHERPAFARKAADYPRGNVPVDAVYYPQRARAHPLR